MDQYLSQPELSASDIKCFKDRGAFVFKKLRDNPQPQKETKSTSFGTAVHYALLEPEKFDENHILDPGWNKNTNKYKEWKKELSPEKFVVTPEFVESVKDIRESLRAAKLNVLVEKGDSEVTFVQEATGMHPFGRRCRPDKVRDDLGFIVDLKTTQSLKWFKNDVFKYGYNLSVPHYTQIVSDFYGKTFRYIFLAIESAFPYPCEWFELSAANRESAGNDYQEQIKAIQRCVESDFWPSKTTETPEEI